MIKAPTAVRVLIVDDEPAARELVREMLKDEIQSGTVQVVGECEDGRAAIEAIEIEKPDLVFLDVQMPEIDGFAVLSAVSAHQLPFIIFVTAYDQYALRAFEVHALDYLLKPFDRERFDHAFERAKRIIVSERKGELSERILTFLEERGAQTSGAAPAQQYLERLVIKTDGRVFFLRADEIEWIEAEGNYVSLHVGKRAYLFREAISSLETQLDPNRFRRIHRSTIVNIDRIKELQPMFRGEYLIIMRDGKELKLSHSYRDRLEQLP
jgi:two-component system LytT family response regulator